MTRRVCIVGIGHVPARPVTPEMSYREMIYDAAVRAYADAGVEPKEVHSFVTCAEDFNEGTSIFDEYTPDQLGAVQKPVHTISGDGLHGLADAVMEIMTGLVDVVVLEAHSKASNILTPHHIVHYAMDPVLQRPLGVNPLFVAGLEMSRFLHESGNTVDQCAAVVVKNKGHALRNSSGCHAAAVTIDQVRSSKPVAEPVKELDVAPTSDGAYVVVLTTEERARKLKRTPVFVRGIGWCNDTPTLESRDWARAAAVETAAQKAYKQAGIKHSVREIDLFEVDDQFSYKELQHLEALGVFKRGESGKAVEKGATRRGGDCPVNVSGGSLGIGYQLEATGLAKLMEIVLQLRGEAGERQVGKARIGLAQSWRGIPTTSAAVAILSNE